MVKVELWIDSLTRKTRFYRYFYPFIVDELINGLKEQSWVYNLYKLNVRDGFLNLIFSNY